MYRVLWHPATLAELARVWTDADLAERQAITAAARDVDHLLSSNPEEHGESREGDQRILFVGPLGLLFEVDAEHQVVRIGQVWHPRRKP